MLSYCPHVLSLCTELKDGNVSFTRDLCDTINATAPGPRFPTRGGASSRTAASFSRTVDMATTLLWTDQYKPTSACSNDDKDAAGEHSVV